MQHWVGLLKCEISPPQFRPSHLVAQELDPRRYLPAGASAPMVSCYMLTYCLDKGSTSLGAEAHRWGRVCRVLFDDIDNIKGPPTGLGFRRG